MSFPLDRDGCRRLGFVELAKISREPIMDDCFTAPDDTCGWLQMTEPSEEKMSQTLESLAVADGDPVRTEHIATALTAGKLAYDDGTNQTFEPGGGTTYVEHQRCSHGEWYLNSQGRFCSFWPPSYRACYDLRWVVEGGRVVGLRFAERDRGTVFVGRYQ